MSRFRLEAIDAILLLVLPLLHLLSSTPFHVSLLISRDRHNTSFHVLALFIASRPLEADAAWRPLS